MKNSSKIRHTTAIVTALATLLALSSCGSTSKTDDSNKIKIAVLGKSNAEYYHNANVGANDAATELGIKIEYDAPDTESEIGAQEQMIRDYTKKGFNAIVIAPLDSKKLNKAIDDAAKKGVKIITFDSDVSTNSRLANITTNNIVAASTAANKAIDLIGGKGNIAIVSHVTGAQTTKERTEGFINEIEKNCGDKVKIDGISYSEGIAETAKKQAKEFIKNDPDLKLIYATNEGSAEGVADAIAELGLKDKIFVIGFDSSDKEISYIRDGTMDGTMVQSPYNMGYLGIRCAYKAVIGEEIEKKFDTGASFINDSNLDNSDMQWLLYPDKYSE